MVSLGESERGLNLARKVGEDQCRSGAAENKRGLGCSSLKETMGEGARWSSREVREGRGGDLERRLISLARRSRLEEKEGDLERQEEPREGDLERCSPLEESEGDLERFFSPLGERIGDLERS